MRQRGTGRWKGSGRKQRKTDLERPQSGPVIPLSSKKVVLNFFRQTGWNRG